MAERFLLDTSALIALIQDEPGAILVQSSGLQSNLEAASARW